MSMAKRGYWQNPAYKHYQTLHIWISEILSKKGILMILTPIHPLNSLESPGLRRCAPPRCRPVNESCRRQAPRAHPRAASRFCTAVVYPSPPEGKHQSVQHVLPAVGIPNLNPLHPPDAPHVWQPSTGPLDRFHKSEPPVVDPPDTSESHSLQRLYRLCLWKMDLSRSSACSTTGFHIVWSSSWRAVPNRQPSEPGHIDVEVADVWARLTIVASRTCQQLPTDVAWPLKPGSLREVSCDSQIFEPHLWTKWKSWHLPTEPSTGSVDTSPNYKDTKNHLPASSPKALRQDTNLTRRNPCNQLCESHESLYKYFNGTLKQFIAASGVSNGNVKSVKSIKSRNQKSSSKLQHLH